MKKIVLLGDSIRMGYDKYVKDSLCGVARVYYPEENCKYALNILRFAHEWKENYKWGDDVDLVHWNAGQWDALELLGDDPLTPVEFYKDLVLRIHKRLRFIFPKAKIVFATTTAVYEEACDVNFRRHNTNIEKFNQSAIDVLAGTDAVINDMYNITLNCPKEYYSGDNHLYTKSGTELLGGKVVSVICEQLNILPTEVNIENFNPEEYSEKEIAH